MKDLFTFLVILVGIVSLLAGGAIGLGVGLSGWVWVPLLLVVLVAVGCGVLQQDEKATYGIIVVCLSIFICASLITWTINTLACGLKSLVAGV